MALQLDTQAKQLLSFVQQQTTRIDAKVEAQITQKATQTGKALSKDQLEQLLIQALPEHKDTIKKLGTQCMCHQSDGTNGDFVTQLVGLHKIEKERAQVYSQPQYVRPTRDPLTAKFILAKEADVMLLFNASKFDQSGRPLLMKIVARESMKDKLPDISNYHTLSKTPDVQYVANDAAFLETKDENETEFDFGDAIAQVSLDKKGKELSRSGAVAPTNERVTQFFSGMWEGSVIVPNLASPVGVTPTTEAGAQLDNSHVQRFEDRIELSLKAKADFPKGGWLEVPASNVDTTMTVHPGYLLEPGSIGSVAFAGASIDASVPKDDFSFIGSGSGTASVAAENYSGWTLAQFLNQSVRQTTKSQSSNGSDAQVVDTAVSALIYPKPEQIEIGGVALQPLGDRVVNKADFAAAKISAHVEPLHADPEKNGQELVIDLAKGFLTGKGESMAGWRIEAGYFAGPSQGNAWVGSEAVKVTAQSGSPEKCLRIQMPNAPEVVGANKNLEIRVYNAQGVPAQRVLIPMTQLPWG